MTIARAAPIQVQPAGSILLAGCLGVCLSAAVLAGCSAGRTESTSDPAAISVLHSGVALDPEVEGFYRDRKDRPLWTSGSALRPEALIALSMLSRAAEHGLDPARYDADEVKAAVAGARNGDQAALKRADFLLSNAYARFAEDVRRPPKAPSVFYVDAELMPRGVGKRSTLEALAAAPSLAAQLEANDRLNPLYDQVRRELAMALDGGITPDRLALMREKLDRARLLPTAAGGRYVLVNTATAQLSMVENGRITDRMRVIVGKPGRATPMMAGLIRFAVLNPFWHIPRDLVATRVAARVLREGPAAVGRDHLEIVSEWGPAARRIDAAEVNWQAVAAGRERLRVRQLPGPHNMMGSIKFMMPNRLGIYLHDTPDKSLFARADRRLSSGCVRVEDSARMARWLFSGPAPTATGAPEERVYLPRPIPVYITYLPVAPGADALASAGAAQRRIPRRTAATVQS